MITYGAGVATKIHTRRIPSEGCQYLDQRKVVRAAIGGESRMDAGEDCGIVSMQKIRRNQKALKAKDLTNIFT